VAFGSELVRCSPKELSFARLNLTRNPFGELPLGCRPGVTVGDFEEPLRGLEAPRATLLFTGEAGRGKTTSLLRLRADRPGPYVYFPEDGPLPPIPRAPLIYLDELQRLGWWARRRLFATDARLVIASHADHRAEVRRAARPLWSRHVTGLSLERLEAIVKARVEASRRVAGPLPEVPRLRLEALLSCYRDDLRSIEAALYDEFQRMDRDRGEGNARDHLSR